MILHIQPVADILSLSIYRKRLAMTDIVDKQRDKLLRELVWTIIVGTVRHDGRHPVSIVERTHEMVRRCLGCTVRAVRLIFCGLVEKVLSVCLMVAAARSFGRKRRRPMCSEL